ncbi:MAG: hypothetical protein R3F19_34085 [Verrucomicrobiales bacterium]
MGMEHAGESEYNEFDDHLHRPEQKCGSSSGFAHSEWLKHEKTGTFPDSKAGRDADCEHPGEPGDCIDAGCGEVIWRGITRQCAKSQEEAESKKKFRPVYSASALSASAGRS